MNTDLKELAKRAINPPYSGDNRLGTRVAKQALDDFHKAATPYVLLTLIEDIDQQRAMKAKARDQRDEAAVMLRELASATLAIIAISDRKHDAWDAAKAVIAKVGGNHNLPERPAPIITNLVRALERFLDNPTPRSDDFDAARSAILAAHNQQGVVHDRP